MSTRSLNKVMLIGNLTRKPDMRYTANGTAVVTFGMATNRNYVDSSGKAVETAEFTNIVAWAKLAEICSNLLDKGHKIFIEGRLQTNSWDDAATGKKMYRTEVVASEMIILSSPGGRNGAGDFNSGANGPKDSDEPRSSAVDMDPGGVDFDQLTKDDTDLKEKSKDEDSKPKSVEGDLKDSDQEGDKSKSDSDSDESDDEGDNKVPF